MLVIEGTKVGLLFLIYLALFYGFAKVESAILACQP